MTRRIVKSSLVVGVVVAGLTLAAIGSRVFANTGSAALDRPRGYDTDTKTFVTDLSLQDQIDGGGAADVAKAGLFGGGNQYAAATASFAGTIYTAVVREVGGGTITHVYLLRNRGGAFEGWDHDTKTWTTAYGNMDPIDSDVSLAYTAANPAIAVDSRGKVYVAYTRTIASGADRKVFMSVYDPTANDLFIWDDGATELTNDLAAPIGSRDSIGNNWSAFEADADNVAPAIAIDSNDDVYIAYSTEMNPGADAKIFLSKFDSSAEDAFIWDDGASQMTNDLRAPFSELDSISVNVANFESSTSPAIAIDSNDMVYIAYPQEGTAGDHNRIWVSRYDPVLDDAFIWSNNPFVGMRGWTNNLNHLGVQDELDSFGNNSHNVTDAVGSPSIAIDSQNNVYVSYIQQSEPGTDPKVWLSKYDVTLDDNVIWHDQFSGTDAFGNTVTDGGWVLNTVADSPDDQLHSFGVNAIDVTDASGRPAILIDNDDDVWVSYTQQTDAPAYPHVYLSKYDATLNDVFIWDDATSTLTNDLSALGRRSGVSWNEDWIANVNGSPSMAMAANGDIYIAYACDSVQGSGNPHVNISYFDVSAEDVFVWDDGAGEWTNDLTVPTTFTDSLDNSSADGDTSFAPVIQATTNGIYIMYLHRPDGTNDHLHAIRIGHGKKSDGDDDDDEGCVAVRSSGWPALLTLVLAGSIVLVRRRWLV